MDESLFMRELGIKSSMLKALDFLMDNKSFDYSKTDIAEGRWHRAEQGNAIQSIADAGNIGTHKGHQDSRQG